MKLTNDWNPTATTITSVIKRYVIPVSLQEEFQRWNWRALLRRLEWGGNLYLKDEQVVLSDVVLGEEQTVEIPKPSNEVRNALGTVHYHPHGTGPSTSDLVHWFVTAWYYVSPKLRPLFLIVHDDGFVWYLFPRREVLTARFRKATLDYWGTYTLFLAAKTYFPKEMEKDTYAGMSAYLEFLTIKMMMDERLIIQGLAPYGKNVEIKFAIFD